MGRKRNRGAGSGKAVTGAGHQQRMIGIRERLNLQRLQRRVQREKELLTDYAPPKPEAPPDLLDDGSRKKKRRNPTPEELCARAVLRGAARPAASLNDGTLDPIGRPLDIRPHGDNLFETHFGQFWTANAATRAHIRNLYAFAAALESEGRTEDAVQQWVDALHLDTRDPLMAAAAATEAVLPTIGDGAEVSHLTILSPGP